MTFIEFWGSYGTQIITALVGIVLACLTWVAITIRADAKRRQAEANAQVDLLTSIASKKDNSPEIENSVSESNTQNKLLAELINIIIQNSSLDSEVKTSAISLVNQIKFGNQTNLVTTLENDKSKLEEQVNTLQTKLDKVVTDANTVVTAVNTAVNTVKKVRK